MTVSAQLLQANQHGRHCKRIFLNVAALFFIRYPKQQLISSKMDFPASPVEQEVFHAMQNVDVDCLSRMSEAKLRPILPALVRMALCKAVDTSADWAASRKTVLNILSNFDVVNGLVALLSIDFHSLEQDVKKEQSLRYDQFYFLLKLFLLILKID